ncbi:MAG: hypothetical protein AABY68_13865 [Pseudomonadota bacterium]
MSLASSSKQSTQAAKSRGPYADEAADVRALLEADDLGETIAMSPAEIKALFKPGQSPKAK